MTLKDLLNSHRNDFEEIAQIIWDMSYKDDIFYNIEESSYNIVKSKLISFMLTLVNKDIDNINGNSVIFVLPQMSTEFKSNKIEYHTFSCRKDEINNVMNFDFTMWTDNKHRLEHYAYDFDDLNDILFYDCFYDSVSSKLALAIIIDELTTFGFDEEGRKNKLNDIAEELKKSFEEENNNENTSARYIDFGEALNNIHNEIIENSTKEEKEEIIKEREEKEKNKDRDYEYMTIVLRINHKDCIKIVEKYYLSKL